VRSILLTPGSELSLPPPSVLEVSSFFELLLIRSKSEVHVALEFLSLIVMSKAGVWGLGVALLVERLEIPMSSRRISDY
jgi:hypothetical protein